MKREWFETWFDSPYYHILYKERNEEEAKEFISNLIQFLQPLKSSKILDLACGAGRHSIYLHALGYHVTGVDLSENSISKAKNFEEEGLNFEVYDMREVYHENHFHYIFNMFTSFGYFEKLEDNLKMLRAVEKSLIKEGVFILDFLNIKSVLAEIKPMEEKVVEGIKFTIFKTIENGMVRKKISFSDKGTDYLFEENVQAFTLNDLTTMIESCNLKISSTFGDYQLGRFNPSQSERLILIVKKK